MTLIEFSIFAILSESIFDVRGVTRSLLLRVPLIKSGKMLTNDYNKTKNPVKLNIHEIKQNNKVNVIEVKWNRNFFSLTLAAVCCFFIRAYSGCSSSNHVFVVIPFHVFRVDRFFDVFSSNVALDKTDFFCFHEKITRKIFLFLITRYITSFSYLNMSCRRSEYSLPTVSLFDEFYN